MGEEDKIWNFKWEIKEEGYVVCAVKLRRRREIDKLGRESVIGIMVLSLVGPKDKWPQKNKYYNVSTQRVSTLKRINSNQKSKLKKNKLKKS